MKNKLLLMGVVILSTALFSCKKDYTCKCTKTYTDSTITTTKDDGTYVFKDNAARASQRCNDQETTGTDLLQGPWTRDCSIY